MTRGARRLSRRLTLLWLAGVVALGAAACGGSSPKLSSSSTTKSSTSTVAKTTSTAPAPVAKLPTVLTETVRDVNVKTFAATTSARAGDAVALRTFVPGKAGGRPKSVLLKVSSGPAKSFTVTARWNGHTSVARIISARGKPLTIARLHYTCLLPPEPTFCPLKRDSVSKSGSQLEVPVVPGAPILVSAVMGPLSTPAPVVHPSSTSVVPAYVPSELVEGIAPVPPSAPRGTLGKVIGPKTSVAVPPHDAVVMVTRLTGAPVGASQALTVTIDQGPARSIAVSAQVAGGRTSTATVTSANGSPMTLVLPNYGCFAPPSPTFCPAKKVVAGNHRYQLTFMASPFTPPLLLVASAAAG